MRTGQPPPLPSKLLRPSHCVSIRFSVWMTNVASVQPVSRLVGLPLPHVSVVLVNVVLFAAFWHCSVGCAGSRSRKLLPECVVAMVTGPFHPELPVPCMTCSWVPSTAPVSASTYTDWMEYSLPSLPVTRVSQASRGALSIVYTDRTGAVTASTLASRLRATSAARAAVIRGLVDRAPIGFCWATETSWTAPVPLVTTTKSPPTTGRPWNVRSYDTYCRPAELVSPCCTYCSSGPAISTDGFDATNALAPRAARTCAPGVGGGAAVAGMARAMTAAHMLPVARKVRFTDAPFPAPREVLETRWGRKIHANQLPCTATVRISWSAHSHTRHVNEELAARTPADSPESPTRQAIEHDYLGVILS